jgi:hypothetical protein
VQERVIDAQSRIPLSDTVYGTFAAWIPPALAPYVYVVFPSAFTRAPSPQACFDAIVRIVLLPFGFLYELGFIVLSRMFVPVCVALFYNVLCPLGLIWLCYLIGIAISSRSQRHHARVRARRNGSGTRGMRQPVQKKPRDVSASALAVCKHLAANEFSPRVRTFFLRRVSELLSDSTTTMTDEARGMLLGTAESYGMRAALEKRDIIFAPNVEVPVEAPVETTVKLTNGADLDSELLVVHPTTAFDAEENILRQSLYFENYTRYLEESMEALTDASSIIYRHLTRGMLHIINANAAMRTRVAGLVLLRRTDGE